ncbi:hypothetical protein LRS06_18035 [Hymenobacter sp. J193]|uniref:hypothetical protein n=1 Tax=Hymenobacter sp. J193 TaxID=2898429 RepID=UPI0021509C61|nr:hypothetical protein [Hymenobacter sp. J193]MCR5889638.1 hypothetical protein [Hymenobacter sp. J193]
MRQFMFLLAICSLLGACTRTYHNVVPGVGTVATREAYPQAEPVRTKKSVQLPPALRTSLEDYRRRNGYWPQTTRTLEIESEAGRRALWQMQRQGYSLTEILVPHPDTLILEFAFNTETRWRTDRDNPGIPLGRELRGRFVFVAAADGQVQVWKTFDNTWRPGRRELLGQRP